jgi:hypothetical protein
MKSRILCICAVIIFSVLGAASVNAQGTAFTYQGMLQSGGVAASGTYNLQFSLYNNSAGSGSPVAGLVTTNGAIVSKGLFTVTIDFGAGPWNGETNWLQIAVETNGASPFTTLTPLQQLTPTPYALYSENATMLAGGVAIGAATENFIANGTSDAFVGGGTNNTIGANSPNADIGGGNGNDIQFNNLDSVIAGGNNNTILHDSGWSAIAGGDANQIDSGWSAIGGGTGNTVGNNSPFSVISGGQNNATGNNSQNSSIAGGVGNSVVGSSSAIGGGSANSAIGAYATVPGGQNNLALGNASFAAGSGASTFNDNTFVWSDGSAPTVSGTNEQFVARASGGFVFYSNNGGEWETFGLGGTVTAGDTIVLILKNVLLNRVLGTIGDASVTNVATAGESFDTIAADLCLGIDQLQYSVTATPNGTNITLAWPQSTTFDYAFVLGGPGGTTSTESIAHSGTLTGTDGDNPNASGVVLASGSGTWGSMSDRNAKNNFAPVNSGTVLASVAALPMTTWSYKSEHGVRHIGPMAQDFYAAFKVGEDERHITEVDEGGVALAAIQGLNEKLEEERAQNAELKQELNELKAEVQSLKKRN